MNPALLSLSLSPSISLSFPPLSPQFMQLTKFCKTQPKTKERRRNKSERNVLAGYTYNKFVNKQVVGTQKPNQIKN